jgi:hypothetical protein
LELLHHHHHQLFFIFLLLASSGFLYEISLRSSILNARL